MRTTLRVVVYDGGWSFIDGATADGLAWDQSESVRWARASVGGTGIADDLSKWLFVAWAEGDVEYPHTSFHDGDLYVAFSEMIDRTFRVRVARANLEWIRPLYPR